MPWPSRLTSSFRQQATVSPVQQCKLRAASAMKLPFGSSKQSQDEESRRPPPSWLDSLGPVVLLSLAGLGTVQLYVNYVRRIPGVDYIRPSFFHSRSLFGKVTSVGDGDNFHMFHTPGGRTLGWGWLRKVPVSRKELKDRTIHIRIAGVDAPERYILHRQVRAYVYRRDQYNRIVATVYVRRFLIRRNVGLEMVKRGLATTYEAKFGAEFGGLRTEYEKAEAHAKKRRIGMWSGKVSCFESPRKYKAKWAASQEKTSN